MSRHRLNGVLIDDRADIIHGGPVPFVPDGGTGPIYTALPATQPDPSAKLSDLLSMASLMSLIWSLFKA